ncbi:MAG TPA: hypothetical protein VMF31_07280 [Solirubrobacterales bacterium]|nr:hypothetical protein [Solirubrobacterales bacterium]
MSVNTLGLSRAARIAIATLLGAALCASVLVLGSSGNANADEQAVKAKRTEVLGAVGEMKPALCPTRCEGLAFVTGIQSSINGVSTPFRVPFNGKITKWKIALGKPTKSQREFFETNFGERPEAGISVLKKVKVDGKTRYLLRRRSPIEGLNRSLGTVTSFTLKKPLKVAKGNYVALTVPTWAPALWTPKACAINPATKKMFDATACTNIRENYSWRASRDRDKCAPTQLKSTSRPQQEVGSKREYGCRFDGSQLLYRVKITNR